MLISEKQKKKSIHFISVSSKKVSREKLCRELQSLLRSTGMKCLM